MGKTDEVLYDGKYLIIRWILVTVDIFRYPLTGFNTSAYEQRVWFRSFPPLVTNYYLGLRSLQRNAFVIWTVILYQQMYVRRVSFLTFPLCHIRRSNRPADPS